jgi:hypothetical protein
VPVADLNDSSPVLIAGGGIGGMALALTLHQIGVPCQVLEAVPALKPLGVGINLQPNAVRELYDLGLGEQVLAHGVAAQALTAYDQRLCADISALVLRNLGAGPFGLLGLVDERCGGVFDHIDDVIPAAERESFMARYKAAAGFAIETLNAAPPTIPPGARVGAGG